MSSAPDLDGRIIAVLQREGSSPAAILSVIDDAELALVQTRDDLARVREVALNPMTPSSELAEHRARLVELQFTAERLEAGLERLRERHREALERVERERREREYVELTAERDRVFARLEEIYARAAAEIADVLEEAVQVNRRIGGWNAQALGGRIDGLADLYRGVRLPAERAGGEAYWPPADRLDAAAMVPAELMKLSEARAAAARELAEARAAWEEAARLHPQRRRVPV